MALVVGVEAPMTQVFGDSRQTGFLVSGMASGSRGDWSLAHGQHPENP